MISSVRGPVTSILSKQAASGARVEVAVDLDHHRLVLRLGDQLARRLIGDQLAMVDDRDAVAQLLGFLEIMGGQHHRHALPVEPADIVPQLLAKLDVDPGGRLVEHQDRRRMNHRLGHQQPPLHAARQGARIGVGLVGQMHRGEQRVGDPLGFGTP